MKSTLLFPGLILLFLTTCVRGQSEDHWQAYQPRTVKSIIDAHNNLKDLNGLKGVDHKKNEEYVSADSFPSLTELVYLGNFRPLPARKVHLLTTWRKMQEQAPPADAFTTELQFKEGAEEYWIAVQQPLVGEFQKELKKGDAVNGYIVVIGAVKVGERWGWLFAMNRFDS